MEEINILLQIIAIVFSIYEGKSKYFEPFFFFFLVVYYVYMRLFCSQDFMKFDKSCLYV